jgi:DNA-binding CsgD family transcriptional regulator
MPSASTVCKRCGKQFNVFPSQVGVRQYCGKDCRMAALREYAAKHNHLQAWNQDKIACSKANRAAVKAMRETGLSVLRIAKRLGLSRERVYQFLRKESE